MIIKQLKYNDCKDKKYKAKTLSDEYLTIEPEGDSFYDSGGRSQWSIMEKGKR